MLTIVLLAVAAAAPGKTMAMDDWGKVEIYGVGGQPTGPLYLQVHAGDLDGDGLPDDAVLKLDCDGNHLRQTQYVVVARDSAGGNPAGKRQYAPVKIVKEWGAASPQLMALRPTYDVKKMKGNERSSMAGEWTSLTIGNAEGLCPAAAAAVVKSKSNITNN